MKKITKIAYLLAVLSYILLFTTYFYFIWSTGTPHHYSEIYFSETMKNVLRGEEVIMIVLSIIWGCAPLTDKEKAIGQRLLILLLYQM